MSETIYLNPKLRQYQPLIVEFLKDENSIKVISDYKNLKLNKLGESKINTQLRLFSDIWDNKKTYHNLQVLQFLECSNIINDYPTITIQPNSDNLILLRRSVNKSNKSEYVEHLKKCLDMLEEREIDNCSIVLFYGLSGKVSPLVEAISNYQNVFVSNISRSARNILEYATAIIIATQHRHNLIIDNKNVIYGTDRLLGFLLAIFSEYELLGKQTTVRKDSLDYYKWLFNELDYNTLPKELKELTQILAYAGNPIEQANNAIAKINRQLKRTDLKNNTLTNLREIKTYLIDKITNQ